MSINERIIRALSSFGHPAVPDIYTGEEARYFVFSYSTVPDLYADDAPEVESYLVQVHYYCPVEENTVLTRKQIKKQLFAEFEAWPRTENASDKEAQHWVFELQHVEEIQWDD